MRGECVLRAQLRGKYVISPRELCRWYCIQYFTQREARDFLPSWIPLIHKSKIFVHVRARAYARKNAYNSMPAYRYMQFCLINGTN